MISQVIFSREALILDRQFIYKEQAHTHNRNKNNNGDFPKSGGGGKFCPTDYNSLPTNSLQSLFATGVGHQKILKNIQSPTVVSNLLYKNITMVIHRFTGQTAERKTYLQESTQREEKKKMSTRNKKEEGKNEQCRESPKRQSLSNSCFKVSNWTPLFLFHLSCENQTNTSNEYVRYSQLLQFITPLGISKEMDAFTQFSFVFYSLETSPHTAGITKVQLVILKTSVKEVTSHKTESKQCNKNNLVST